MKKALSNYILVKKIPIEEFMKSSKLELTSNRVFRLNFAAGEILSIGELCKIKEVNIGDIVIYGNLGVKEINKKEEIYAISEAHLFLKKE